MPVKGFSMKLQSDNSQQYSAVSIDQSFTGVGATDAAHGGRPLHYGH